MSIIDYLPDDVSDDGYESLDSNVARSDAKDISGHEEESLTATKGSKAGPTFYGEPCTLALIKYPWKKSAMENPSGLNKLFSRLSPSRSLQWYQDRWASIFSDQSHDYESFKAAANTFVEDFLSTFDVDRKQPASGSPYMQVWPEIVFGGQNLHIKAYPTCIYHSDLHDIFLNSSMISFFY